MLRFSCETQTRITRVISLKEYRLYEIRVRKEIRKAELIIGHINDELEAARVTCNEIRLCCEIHSLIAYRLYRNSAHDTPCHRRIWRTEDEDSMGTSERNCWFSTVNERVVSESALRGSREPSIKTYVKLLLLMVELKHVE